MNNTPKRMPIVKKETVWSTGQSLLELPDSNFTKDIFDLMNDENPILCQLVCEHLNEAMLSENDFQGAMQNMLAGVATMYTLIRHQAEADDMNETMS